MPNDYFQFKQFLIRQDKCAMKVCTDACLFGAWLAAQSSKLKAHSLLDIGTGTGLLSLMLAQQLPDAIIDAVEIDEAAAQQARENFDASKWKERLKVHHNSIQQFALKADKKYDVIIANPPFYENDLKSNDAKRNVALHSSDLKLEELVAIADKLLSDDGSFFVLLPFGRMEYFEGLCEGKFWVRERVLVKQSEGSGWFREMVWMDRNAFTKIQSEINIVEEKNKYAKAFINLLREYYLSYN